VYSRWLWRRHEGVAAIRAAAAAAAAAAAGAALLGSPDTTLRSLDGILEPLDTTRRLPIGGSAVMSAVEPPNEALRPAMHAKLEAVRRRLEAAEVEAAKAAAGNSKAAARAQESKRRMRFSVQKFVSPCLAVTPSICRNLVELWLSIGDFPL
jgi:hypothetical protein